MLKYGQSGKKNWKLHRDMCPSPIPKHTHLDLKATQEDDASLQSGRLSNGCLSNVTVVSSLDTVKTSCRTSVLCNILLASERSQASMYISQWKYLSSCSIDLAQCLQPGLSFSITHVIKVFASDFLNFSYNYNKIK